MNNTPTPGSQKMISSMPIWGSKGGDGYGKQCWLTIENTPFQCDAGSNPGVDHILGLSLFLVLSFALRGFSPGAQVFPSPQNQFFVFCWFSPLLWEVFLWVLRFSLSSKPILCLLLVLSLAVRGFSLGPQVFPSPQNQFFQSPIRSVAHRHV